MADRKREPQEAGQPSPTSRRDALKRIASIGGLAVAGWTVVGLAGCGKDYSSGGGYSSGYSSNYYSGGYSSGGYSSYSSGGYSSYSSSYHSQYCSGSGYLYYYSYYCSTS